ncbi:hypothetical protein [Melittangium boletus]|uniref:hypothetical protein n=1 Tax=Melittangium boletus TaxID=83453 RepID=UPI003DA4F153
MKPLCVALCLVAGGAWAQEEAKAPEERRPAFWLQPVAPILVNAALFTDGAYIATLPVGLNLPVSRRWDLVLELTPILKNHRYGGGALAMAAAVGTAWFMQQRPAHDGFFLQPKLVGVIAYDRRNDFSESYQGPFNPVEKQLSLGLDLGYRIVVRGGFLDLLLGGSVGWGWNVPSSDNSLFLSLAEQLPSGYREDKRVWDPNLHLLRIGLTL